MKSRLALALLLTMTVSACSWKRQEPSAQARNNFAGAFVDTQRNAFVVHNLVYCKKKPSLEQTLDLYIPAFGQPPYPLIIWVHGGSWMYGDKNEKCPALDSLLGKFAVASVNYRLDNEAYFPAQIHDLKAAVRFLRSKAKTYKLDPQRFGIWGESAGAHLAALLGTSGDVAELEGNEGFQEQSSKVQAVCDWSGPTDFNSADKQAPPYCKIKFSGQSSPIFVLMGAKMDKASLAKASPVTYVSADDPPFLIMHGDKDDAIPPLQSKELADALRAKKVDVDFRLIPGEGHSLSNTRNIAVVKQFFEAQLGSPKRK